MSIKASLEPVFTKAKSAPILFAGAGFSRRYLKTPDWAALLAYFTQWTPHVYDYYRSRAADRLPEVGTLIAQDFHEVWFTDDDFETSRNEFAVHCKSPADPIKYEIARYLKSFDGIYDELEELDSLRRVSLEAIITTNYDSLLEKIFESYTVFSDQDSLILDSIYGAGEIYKIHGTLESPRSLVITSEDYNHFKERNLILAAKLLTLIVEHPVIFLGYSLSDENVRTILTSIVKCLSPIGLGAIRDSIVIVEWSPGEQEGVTKRSLRIDDVDLPYTHVSCHTFHEVFDSMASFERRFPVKLLRELKKSLYELVEESDPVGRLAVVDIDNPEDLKNADFVIGIGVQDKLGQVGYTGLGRDDVFRFVLDGGEYSAEALLRNVIPQIAKGNANCPVFRFLRESGRVHNTEIDVTGLADSVADLAKADASSFVNKSYSKSRKEVDEKFGTLADLTETYGVNGALYRIALLDPVKIDLDGLRDFLKLVEADVRNQGGSHISNWRKVVCYYDYLRFRLQ